MSRIMSEEASVHFAAEAALKERREEMRFSGAGDAAALQAWLRRVFGAADEAGAATPGAAEVAPTPLKKQRSKRARDVETYIGEMLVREAGAARRV